MTGAVPPRAVVWHDVECGSYREDLPVWRAISGSSVLDLGAGTGRVALDLAAAGHDVTALDLDPVLLEALSTRARARGLDVRVVEGDARSFALDRRFDTILCPMQTVQLLGGAPARAAHLRCVAAHLAADGTYAAALAVAEPHEATPSELPAPDRAVHGDWLFLSQPLAVREDPARAVWRIERLRTARGPARLPQTEPNVIELDVLDVATFEDEVGAAGLEVLPRLTVGSTDEHVGSEVVVARG